MPDFIERRECPACGAEANLPHRAWCRVDGPIVVAPEQAVTVRYARLSVAITDEMVARAEKAWMLWKAPVTEGADRELNARRFMRAILDAALNPPPEQEESDGSDGQRRRAASEDEPEQGVREDRAPRPVNTTRAAMCEPGATAVHVNSGETWTVAERLPGGGYLIVRSSRGIERKVERDYWLGEAWADR